MRQSGLESDLGTVPWHRALDRQLLLVDQVLGGDEADEKLVFGDRAPPVRDADGDVV